MFNPRQTQGSLLIETAVALAVFSLLVLALMDGGVFAYKSIVETGRRNQAAAVAQAKIEELLLLDYASVTTSEFQPDGFTAGRVEVSELEPGLKRVKVTVFGQAEAPLATLITYVRCP